MNQMELEQTRITHKRNLQYSGVKEAVRLEYGNNDKETMEAFLKEREPKIMRCKTIAIVLAVIGVPLVPVFFLGLFCWVVGGVFYFKHYKDGLRFLKIIRECMENDPAYQKK